MLCGVGQIFCGWRMRKKIPSGEVSQKSERGVRKSKQMRENGKDELCNSKLLLSIVIPGQPMSPDVRAQTDIGSERFNSRATSEESTRDSHAAMDSMERSPLTKRAPRHTCRSIARVFLAKQAFFYCTKHTYISSAHIQSQWQCVCTADVHTHCTQHPFASLSFAHIHVRTHCTPIRFAFSCAYQPRANLRPRGS